jgi:hypothetical protein
MLALRIINDMEKVFIYDRYTSFSCFIDRTLIQLPGLLLVLMIGENIKFQKPDNTKYSKIHHKTYLGDCLDINDRHDGVQLLHS